MFGSVASAVWGLLVRLASSRSPKTCTRLLSVILPLMMTGYFLPVL